jgi:hypothetical protein
LSTDLDYNTFMAMKKNIRSPSNSLFDLCQGVRIAFLIDCSYEQVGILHSMFGRNDVDTLSSLCVQRMPQQESEDGEDASGTWV